ncbi:MAG: alpha/beta hydrolase [Pseudomonadota bacterium]
MPLLRINATDQGLQLHRQSGPWREAVGATDATSGPMIIMVHGFKYAPESATHCPHEKIFAMRAGGWPPALGFYGCPEAEGLGIAFGWYARGPLWQVHRRAAHLGRMLADLVIRLRDAAPERPVHVIAHSMGSEIALSALEFLPRLAIRRMILLTGASYASRAQAALITPAGQTSEVFNVISRENDLFDLAFERLVPAPKPRDRAVGQGIDRQNVLNLQLDCPQTLSTLDGLGLPVAAARRRVCHWSSYTRPGVMAFYAKLLRDPEHLPQARLAQLLPRDTSPRWSRLMKAPAAMSSTALTLPDLAATARALRAKTGFLPAAPTARKHNEPVC